LKGRVIVGSIDGPRVVHDGNRSNGRDGRREPSLAREDKNYSSVPRATPLPEQQRALILVLGDLAPRRRSVLITLRCRSWSLVTLGIRRYAACPEREPSAGQVGDEKTNACEPLLTHR
jgi:hypothetical protein